MEEDILDRLKSREDELEAGIEEARQRAALIRREAHERARRIGAEVEKAFEKEAAAKMEKAKAQRAREAAETEERGRAEFLELKEKASRKKEAAVLEVMSFIAGRE